MGGDTSPASLPVNFTGIVVTEGIPLATDASVDVGIMQVHFVPLVRPESGAVLPVVCVEENVDPPESNTLSR